jgi:hypothetical protein
MRIRPLIQSVFRKTLALARKWASIFPTAVWNTFGVLGVLIVGLVFGFIIGAAASADINNEDLVEENDNLRKLVGGYEELKYLYDLQGDNVSIMLDPDLIYTNPEEVEEAYDSAGQYRDEILVQLGRIYELRSQVNLPETYDARSN